MSIKYSLSEAAKQLEINLRNKGKLISYRKMEMINRFIGVAAAKADNDTLQLIGTQTTKERSDMWDQVYHTEMDKITKAEGLRV